MSTVVLIVVEELVLITRNNADLQSWERAHLQAS